MKPPKKTIPQVKRSNQHTIDNLLNSKYDFILSDDPLIPIKPCTSCGHNKGFIVYTYKRWEEHSKKLSHFGLIRCDRCGAALSWIDGVARELLIKKHGFYL